MLSLSPILENMFDSLIGGDWKCRTGIKRTESQGWKLEDQCRRRKTYGTHIVLTSANIQKLTLKNCSTVRKLTDNVQSQLFSCPLVKRTRRHRYWAAANWTVIGGYLKGTEAPGTVWAFVDLVRLIPVLHFQRPRPTVPSERRSSDRANKCLTLWLCPVMCQQSCGAF